MPHQCTSYKPPLELIGDLCLKDYDAKVGDHILTYFPASSLPMNPAQRFGKLFDARETWKEEDISFFIRGISTGNHNSVSSLLLKYAILQEEAEGTKLWIQRPTL